MIFSCLAYFLVEYKEPNDADSKLTYTVKHIIHHHLLYFFKGENTRKNAGSKTTRPKLDDRHTRPRSSNDAESASKHRSSTSQNSADANQEAASAEQSPNIQNGNHPKKSSSSSNHKRFRGRRFLLLMSFAAGVITLFLTSMMFNIPDDSGARSPMINFFIIVFTAFYSPVSIPWLIR